MAFKFRQDVYSLSSKRDLLANSLTFKVGDVIVPTGSANTISNLTSLVAGDRYPIGVLIGFTKANGEVITTGQDPANTPNQLTTAADNTTVAKYYGEYYPITAEMEFSALLSATAGTTTNSDAKFTWFNLSDARTIDETSVQIYTYASAPLQVMSLGLDPADTTNKTLIVKFAKYGVLNNGL